MKEFKKMNRCEKIAYLRGYEIHNEETFKEWNKKDIIFYYNRLLTIVGEVLLFAGTISFAIIMLLIAFLLKK